MTWRPRGGALARASLAFLLSACAAGPSSNGVAEVCDNGIDDDRDEAVDCDDTDCATSCPELCWDQIDNDADGFIDCHDLDCDGQCVETCEDGRDNDGDGDVDCDDTDCVGWCPEVCDDGLDNDGDGWADCLDPGCTGMCPEDCDDQRDNDGDLAIDCRDPDCDGSCPESCGDGRDNDGDGDVDCRDEDCVGACPEVCDDDLDNDADGLADCDDPDCDRECDLDGDGFVSSALGGDDCDDTDPSVHAGAPEVCNGVDDNCDALIDDADPLLDPVSTPEWYTDVDGDGYGDPGTEVSRCISPPGTVSASGDCDDADPLVPAAEVCSGADDDCDGLVDDADPDVDPTTMVAWYPDTDGDGWGAPDESSVACAGASGEVDNGDDCDDSNPDVGAHSEWLFDGDGDGYGAGPIIGPPSCIAPTPDHHPASLGVDCDDDDPLISPGAPEVCEDGVDNDCDPRTNDLCSVFFDDFEDGDFGDWTVIAAGQTPGIDTIGADGTSLSLRMSGGAFTHYNGVMWEFADETPSSVRFFIRGDSRSGARGYVVFGGAPIDLTNQAVFFHLVNGRLRCYDGVVRYHGPFNRHTWHEVEFRLDWAGQTFDFYSDGVLRAASVPFRGYAPTLQELHFYNYNNENAWIDQIDIQY